MNDKAGFPQVTFDAQAAAQAGRKLFMCRHQGRSPDARLEDVLARHEIDISLQDKYNLRWITYYVDMERDTSFCLAESPSREAVEACHREAHGSLPFRVIEVDAAMLELFLGDIPTPAPADPMTEGPIRTLLCTRLANATSLSLTLGDQIARSAMREHEAIVREAVEAHAGREIKTDAPGMLVAFTSAASAVQCAMDIQGAVQRRNASKKRPILAVSVGLNAGEPVTAEAGLFGAAVQLANSITSLAKPGSIIVAGVVRDLCLGKGFDFVDRGVEEITDFGGVRLYEVSPGPIASVHPDGLSDREVQVLRLLAGGRSNQQIAAELFISFNTVARHVAHILEKTGAANRTEAAAYAYREGIA